MLSQDEAAKKLGLTKGGYQHYERGRSFGKVPREVSIPRSIALACAAIKFGLPPVGTENHHEQAD